MRAAKLRYVCYAIRFGNGVGKLNIQWTADEEENLVLRNYRPMQRPVQRRQDWLAGVIVSYLTGSGVIIHFLVSGERESIGVMAVGGLFIPTLAVTLGIWSGNGKLFQLVFMLMWYVCPLNKMDILDFIGTTQQSLDRGFYRYYLLATVILLRYYRVCE